MNEETAKTKWCPMVRVALNNDGIATNRDTQAITFDPHKRFEFETRCLASQCMMWRHHANAEDMPSGYGHCGLAGPEFVA